MDICNITYRGPKIDDSDTLDKLPGDYRNLLFEINGFIQLNGGFHVRGACSSPNWHALSTVWSGELSLYKLFSKIEISDIPFGEDCLGDQYFIRNEVVCRLSGETGKIESLDTGLLSFIENIQKDPIEILGLQPLILFEKKGKKLIPGQLLNAYPPFCTKESRSGVSITAVPFDEQIKYLSQLSSFLGNIPDGEIFKITVK